MIVSWKLDCLTCLLEWAKEGPSSCNLSNELDTEANPPQYPPNRAPGPNFDWANGPTNAMNDLFFFLNEEPLEILSFLSGGNDVDLSKFNTVVN